jgi:hypothetical protein
MFRELKRVTTYTTWRQNYVLKAQSKKETFCHVFVVFYPTYSCSFYSGAESKSGHLGTAAVH